MSEARASNFSKRGKSWTYKRIEAEFLGRYGRKPKSCWIASLLEPRGLTRGYAWNRHGEEPLHPCPPEHRENLLAVMRSLGAPV